VYRWQAKPYSIGEDVALAQFHLARASHAEAVGLTGRRDRTGFRNDSTVSLNFLFERQTGFFLLQIYTPLTLIVFCSWVSFWLVKTEKGGEVPARTALGATTVLSIVNLGFGGKSKPKVGYATAMDMYIILCFFAVFAALVEFACINFVDTFIKRFKVWEAEQKAKISESEVEVNGKEEKENIVEKGDANAENGEMEVVILIPAESERMVSVMQQQPPLARSECGVSTVSTQDACVSTEDEDFEDLQEAEEEPQPGCPLLSRLAEQAVDRLFERLFRKYSPTIPQLEIYSDTLAVIYSIDSWARTLFPLVFALLQTVYWTAYLYVL